MKSLTLELGASRRWRDYDGGRWESVRDLQGRVHRVHTPAQYNVIVSDGIADGLQVASDDWQREHGKLADGRPLPGREPHGVEARMLRVSNLQDAGEDPPAGLTPVQAIVEGFGRVLREVLSRRQPA